jgi:hypothetical protein
MGVACAAVGGGVQPLSAVVVQSLAGASVAAICSYSIGGLFTVWEEAGGHGEAHLDSVLDAPAHVLLLAGFAAVPTAMVLSAFAPLPAAVTPGDTGVASAMWAVQLLAVVGTGMWSATTMRLIMLVSGSASAGNQPEQLFSPHPSVPPSAQPKPIAFPLAVHAPPRKPMGGSHRHLEHGTPSSPSEQAWALLATSRQQVQHAAVASRSTLPPAERRAAIEVPIILPTGDTAMISISDGNDIEQLVMDFCIARHLSQDCVPHIRHFVSSRCSELLSASAAPKLPNQPNQQ